MGAPLCSGLLTDSYHFTMLQAYLDHGMTEPAVFEFFARRLPRNRNFLIAAGLEQALEFIENLRFTEEELGWLAGHGHYRENLFAFLRGFRFSGDVHAMPEGTVFFENEPIFRVRAPLPEAQLLESRLVNLLHYQTLVASKAARSVLAANDNLLVEFGMRRAHGAEAALFASRASYLAGFDATSNVLAGKVFAIPVSGTMAHSFIEADHSEGLAFEHFSVSNPDQVVLLLDTYDTARAARKVTRIAASLRRRGCNIRGVRLDSGDLRQQAHCVREILDAAGLNDVMIFASGNLDEGEIQSLLEADAPINGFGVGTHLTTSEDAPALDCAYKLEEYAGQPRRKRSAGKATMPGPKQVFRHFRRDGSLDHDVIALDSEPPDGRPLLKPFIRAGRRVAPAPPLEWLRTQCISNVRQLPARFRQITESHRFDVRVSQPLAKLTQVLESEFADLAA